MAKNRKRFTRAERREMATRPNPEEISEEIPGEETDNIIVQPEFWREIDGLEPFSLINTPVKPLQTVKASQVRAIMEKKESITRKNFVLQGDEQYNPKKDPRIPNMDWDRRTDFE